MRKFKTLISFLIILKLMNSALCLMQSESTHSHAKESDGNPLENSTDSKKPSYTENDPIIDPEKEEEEEHPNEAYVIYFIVITLLIGSICREITKKTSLPYTPQLLLIGLVLGSYYKYLGTIGISLDKILSMNPKAILFIFIPILIFESAFNVEQFILKREFWQVILLAVPGVFIGLFMIGFAFRIILGYGDEFSWSACFMFASIICATDPVAVVALLKSIGTPHKFNVLLEGESLLNDGSAMVFYLMFKAIFEGHNSGIFSSIFLFVYLSFGGVFMGVLGGFLVILWMKKIVKDEILNMNLIVISCYMTFFVSEFYLEVSGIIAIVTLGVFMGRYARVSMHPSSEHSIHSILSYLQYALESILFVITGAFIGKDVIGDGLQTIDEVDVLKMIIFFFLMTIARFLMLLILKYPINKTGWEISNKDIVILTYGGLRGAIALSLGLMVAVNEHYTQRYREIVIFYITTMITLTVILNGLSIKYVIQKINFIPEEPIKHKIQEGIKKQLIIGVFERKNVFLQNKFLQMASWEEIIKISNFKEDIMELKETNEKTKKNLLELKDSKEPLLGNNEHLIETRFRFYQLLKAEIWNTFEQSLCSSKTVNKLNDMIDLCSENIERPIWIWNCISSEFLTLETIQTCVNNKDLFLLGYFFKKYLTSELLHNYELLFTLITGFRNINDTRKSLPINLDYIKLVFAEINVDLKNCEDYLFHLMEVFPDLTKAIQEKHAAKMLLNTQKSLLEEFLKKGTITTEECHDLVDKIDKKLKFLEISPSQWVIPNIDKLQLICPIFQKLSPDLFKLIKENRLFKEFPPKTDILLKDKIMTGVFIIIKGVVVEEDEIISGSQGMGAVLNFGNVINKSGNSLTTVRSIGNVSTFFIPNQTLLYIMGQDKDFEEAIYRQACFYLFRKEKLKIELDENKIHDILNFCVFKTYEKDTLVEMNYGGYLFSGSLQEYDYENKEINQIFKANCFIPSKKMDYKCLTEVKLFKFTENIEEHEYESFRASVKITGKDSFANLYTAEQDIDRLYNHIERRILA
jgi:NhaP-type Na+/H+ or K+/H+ antiporter